MIRGGARTYHRRAMQAPRHVRLRDRVRAACAGAVLVTTALSQSTAPVPPTRPKDQAELFRRMAAMTGLEAKFEEEKHLLLLAAPLRSSGRLFFLKTKDGGHLTRIVEAPEPSTIRISPRELRVQNRDGTEVIDLARADKVRAFVTSLVHVFAGDEAALAKTYAVTFTADPKDDKTWELALVPRDKPLNQILKTLRLVGEGAAVVRIEMHEPNGDRTVTRIVAADPARDFDAADRKRLFGVEPK